MTPLTDYRPLKTLSLLAIAGLGVFALCDLLSIIVGLGQMASPTSSLDLDEEGSVSVWLMLQGFVYLIKFPVYIFTVTMFLVWLHRAHSNLQPLLAQNVEFTPGWAVGWWFIPFANLVKPFQAVREVWVESDPDGGDGEASFLSASVRSAPVYMGVWWGLWLVSNIVSNIAGRIYDPDTMSDVGLGALIFIIPSALSIIAAIPAIMVVKDITERQTARAANLGSRITLGDAPPPPPMFGGNQY
jgi:Domain of unknown function (DUF4328)